MVTNLVTGVTELVANTIANKAFCDLHIQSHIRSQTSFGIDFSLFVAGYLVTNGRFPSNASTFGVPFEARCELIINGGSCTNVAFMTLIDKLEVPTKV